MVERIICCMLLIPHLLFAAEFSASVNPAQVSPGEGVLLTLTLKGASAKSSPHIDALKSAFAIASQQHFNQMSVVNGQVDSSETWKLTLLPQREGELVIPGIAVESSAGLLATQPLTVRVFKGASSTQRAASPQEEVTAVAEASNKRPYSSEPIVYTVKVVAKSDLRDVRIDPPSLEGAVVEPYGEPRAYQQRINNQLTSVAEFSFLITPLRAGTLTIPPVIVQGKLPVTRSSSHYPMDDEFDPFSMLRGFASLKPIAVRTEELSLEVQPSLSSVSPWLPAKAVALEETWSNAQQFVVGEPILWGITLKAEGVRSSQLPGISDRIAGNASFKSYADKPELTDSERGGSLLAMRQEQLTLVPQKAGPLNLPGVTVEWWDVVNKEKKTATIPPKTIEILPSVKSEEEAPQLAWAEGVAEKPLQSIESPLLYALIGALSTLLVLALVWGSVLMRKITLQQKGEKPQTEKKRDAKKSAKATVPYNPFTPPVQEEMAKEKREKLPDLNPT